MKKILGYTLIVMYLIYVTTFSAVQHGYHALWIVPVSLMFWIGLGALLGYLLNDKN